MKRVSTSRSVFAGLVTLLATLAAFGCSKKLTIDPGIVPEGVVTANSRLIVFQDLGNNVDAKKEFPPNSGTFLLDSSFTVYNYGPGTIQGVVLDGTAATNFEIMRQQPNGGLGPIKDFTLTPTNKWLQSHWETYPFFDQPNDGTLPPTYQGRGVVSGQVTTSAPLTNTAVLGSSAVVDCKVTSPFIDTVKHDSLPTVIWQPVAGAANYYLHVYQYRGDIKVGSEKFVYGIPAPVALGKIQDFFVGILPGTTTSYKIGAPGAQILHNIPMIGPDRFFFRVTAVDVTGRLIGCTVGSNPDTVRIGAESYIYFPAAEMICIGCRK